MTPALLRRCAEAYSREAGTSGLAGALGVTASTVRRWLSGYTAIPDGLARELEAIMLARAGELRDEASECEAIYRELARTRFP